jgi:hypothetical protein
MEKKRNIYWDLVVKAEGKRLLGNPKQRWENSRKICLTEKV